MTNAIASWHKENPSLRFHTANEDQGQLTAVLEQLQSELKEKTWQLNQVCFLNWTVEVD